MKEKILKNIMNNNRNLVIDGYSGIGKTKNVMFDIVNEKILNNESFVFTDSKEEYLNKYYNELKEKGYNTIIINLKDMTKSDGWNPLNLAYEMYLKKNECYLDILESIGKILFKEEGTIDKFWEESASDIFVACALGLFEDASRNEINFNSINDMLNSGSEKLSNKTYLREYFEYKGITSNEYVYASNTINAPTETLGGIMSVAKQKLRLYLSRESLNNLLKESTFYYEDLLKKPTAMFVISRNDSFSVNRIACMLLEEMYNFLKTNVTNYKYNFILDNYDELGYSANLVERFNSALENKFKYYIITRDLNNFLKQTDPYISQLCDGLSIGEYNISLYINSTIEKIKYTFPKNNDVDIKTNISYPIAENKISEIFNIKRFVAKKKHKEIFGTEEIDSSKYPYNFEIKKEEELSAHDLMKKIDAKIAELESDIKENGDTKIERKTANDNNEKISAQDVDKLLKEIDAKLEELNKEEQRQQEKLNSMKSSNIKSIFQNYKIKEND